jgi:serine/threonine protein kinase/Flp pilus assembly protein TadD
LTLRAGQLLSERWRVITQVSSGGQGRVYLVSDVQTSEKCAAKVFQLKGYENRRLARARVEIEAIKKLKDSPNVVQIRDENISSAEPGLPVELFYVMDYAAHGSLADNDFYIGDVEQCLRVFKEILIGVREAHRKGVIHRDLKPANILLYPTQRGVIITDFGLGLIKDRETDEKITQQDELLGPRFFMAPEQYVSPSEANERSDIYSLGKILYYMLTGKGKVFREQLDDITKDLKEPNPYIPQVQELLLNRMVAEKSADRFINVDEAIDAVERIISQIEANFQRYLKPTHPSENMFAQLAGPRRDLLIGWFKDNIVLAMDVLEGAIPALRKEDKKRTIESLREDLLKRYPSGKINAAIKSVIAFVANPAELAAMEVRSRFSFPSYYMARYYIQSLAFGTAHSYMVKALEIEKDSALQLHYLLTFEEICRKCNCALPHDYDQRILPLIRSSSESQQADLLRTLGQHFLKFGQERRGLRFLEAYLDATPYDHGTRFDCAYAYAELNDMGLAIHHYSILATNEEDSERRARVMNNLGASYESLGMDAMAMTQYREAYELGFTISGANVAGRYISIGMLDQAKALLDEIVATYPKTYHENVALNLGKIVTTRRDEEKKQGELEAAGAFFNHQNVQAVKALVGDRQFSWVGRWNFGDVTFECSQVDGTFTVSRPENVTGEFKATVTDNCLEVISYKKGYELSSKSGKAGKTGIFYLASDSSFTGYLVASNGTYENVTGNRC